MSDSRLLPSDTKYLAPLSQVVDWVAAQIPEDAKVLEIGPGKKPFPRATHFVDWLSHGAVAEDNLTGCDIQRDPLPFADKSWDFVYCRHVLEDLYDPFHLCDEMSRVARAGYLETPSPLAEICRGIDGGSPPWRGYAHHRYFVWTRNSVLQFLSKYPAVEHLSLADETAAPRILRRNALAWNTGLLWQGEIRRRYHQHGIDYDLNRDYRKIVVAGVNEGLAETRSLRLLLEAESGSRRIVASQGGPA
jgi:hypothetical protein